MSQTDDVFEVHRQRLRGLAYRMLGSVSEADDALQEAWLRVDQAGLAGVDNVAGWLTTIVARVCLNLLRGRAARGEAMHVPDPVVAGPEEQVVLADEIGIALMVVLDTLTPNERVAFVLHDSFGVPFETIGEVLGLSAAASRQLASRARRRIVDVPTPDSDPQRQRAVVTAFFAASRAGDFDALLAVLHPDVVLRSDGGAARPLASTILRGAAEVARNALGYASLAPFVQHVLVNGLPGVVVAPSGRVVSVMAFTVADGLVREIDVLADPERLARLLADWVAS